MSLSCFQVKRRFQCSFVAESVKSTSLRRRSNYSCCFSLDFFEEDFRDRRRGFAAPSRVPLANANRSRSLKVTLTWKRFEASVYG